MTSYLGFGIPGGWELWIILAIFLLLFGHRIPGMARAMGSGIVEFKKGLKDPGDSETGDLGDSPPNDKQGSGAGDTADAGDGPAKEKQPQDTGTTNG